MPTNHECFIPLIIREGVKYGPAEVFFGKEGLRGGNPAVNEERGLYDEASLNCRLLLRFGKVFLLTSVLWGLTD